MPPGSHIASSQTRLQNCLSLYSYRLRSEKRPHIFCYSALKHSHTVKFTWKSTYMQDSK